MPEANVFICCDCGRSSTEFKLYCVGGSFLRMNQIRCYACALVAMDNRAMRLKIDETRSHVAPYCYHALDPNATLMQWGAHPTTVAEWDTWLALPSSGEGGDLM